MGVGAWFPEFISGSSVVLRRHVPANVSAFQRWYSDAEVARLARYQDGPMRPDEIDRFFQLRALGSESLTMAIHLADSDRLIGSCAFSQVDGENGSAMYHITIGEKDVWGRGFGTEATQLMLDHAFGTLGLHRIALTVFEFNERAIRAYVRCGFVVEGRARESIWRDGRWWDELAMSVLSSEWHERRGRAGSRASAVSHARVGHARANHPADSSRRSLMASVGPAADAARASFRELMDAKGHAVENARAAVAGLEGAFASGALVRTPLLSQMLGDLMVALEQDEGQKLGGKSAEAARFILRAISRELDNA